MAVGACVMLVALVATPGRWTYGYVSEAGTIDQPYADAYRSGLIVLAAGVGLLGLAVRRHRPAGGALVAAAVLAATSGAVACTAGCPLPPFEATTPRDVLHGVASIAGMAVLAGAMAAVAWRSGLPPVARRLGAAGVTLAVPLGAAQGLTMLFAGRGPLGATLERILLVVAVTWLVGTAVAVAVPGDARDRDP